MTAAVSHDPPDHTEQVTTIHPAVAQAGVVSGTVEDALELACPRCGLSIRPRVPWLTVEHCPRCIAYARIPVRMAAAGAPSARPGARTRHRHPRPAGDD